MGNCRPADSSHTNDNCVQFLRLEYTHNRNMSREWTVREAGPADRPRWSGFIRNQPDATFYHQAGWGDIIQSAYGIEPWRILCERDGNIEAVVQLFRIRVPFVGTVIASDIYTSYGGIVSSSDAGAKELMAWVADQAQDMRIKYVELKNQHEWQSPGWQTKSDYCTMRLSIERGASHVWNKWDKRVRQSVRQAERSGISVEFGNHQLSEFYDIVAMDKHRLGTPVHALQIFENIVETFPDQVFVLLARYKGKAVNAQLVTEFGGILDMLMGGMLFEYRKLKPRNLCIWKLLELAEERGCTHLDFGRSIWESNTFEFKRHLDAEPVPLSYQYFLGKANEVPRIHQDNQRFSLAIKAWQFMPHPLTRWLGPQLIRYIP
jgi:FemAB-related protein (PEP-CTERM system-associated)